MTPYDGVMIGVVVGGMIWGAMRGITWQLASIASLVLGYLFSHQVSAYIAPSMPGDPVVQRAASMLAAYVIVSGGVFFVAWSVRATLRKIKFEAYDRHLGMMLGGAEGVVLGIVGTMFVVSLAPGSREPIFSSYAGRVVAQVMDAAGPVLPAEVRKVVTPFWEHTVQPSGPEGIARDDDPQTPPTPQTSADVDTLGDLTRRARSRVSRAVGDAVKAEVDRIGELGDETAPRRR